MIPSTGTAGASFISSRAVLGWERGRWHPHPGQQAVSWEGPLLARAVREESGW